MSPYEVRRRGLLEVLLVVLLFAWAEFGCASLPHVSNRSEPEPTQSDGVLRLAGRRGLAHACPVGPTRALTAAHVTDERWFDLDFPLSEFVWSDGLGNDGVLRPVGTSPYSDLAAMESDRPFTRWYEVATEAPKPGDLVRTIGYDKRTSRSMFAPREYEAEVYRVVARNVVFSRDPDHGASGACVFNSSGQVVAVVSWSAPPEVGDRVAVGVGVWRAR